MSKPVRKGRVSSIDYEHGMIAVTYADNDDNTTLENASFAWTDEYKMPKVGDVVLVLHESDGAASYALGKLWNKAHVPRDPGEGKFRKDLGTEPGEAYLDYDSATKKLTLYAETIEIIAGTDTVTIKAPAAINENAPLVAADALITSGTDTVSAGISLVSHTHTGVHGETSKPN